MPAMPVRAVLLDLGDTILKLHPMEGRIAERAAAIVATRHGMPAARAAALTGAMAAAIDAALLEVSLRGGPEEADLPGLWRAQLELATLDRGLARELAALTGHEDVARFACPDSSVEALRSLRADGYALAIVSNTLTAPAMMDAALAEFGLLELFAARVYSVALGWRKPAAAIYHAALDALAVSPREALFVGDRMREDVVAPGALGMRGVLTHEHRQEAPGPEAFAVVRALSELRPLLAGLA